MVCGVSSDTIACVPRMRLSKKHTRAHLLHFLYINLMGVLFDSLEVCLQEHLQPTSYLGPYSIYLKFRINFNSSRASKWALILDELSIYSSRPL